MNAINYGTGDESTLLPIGTKVRSTPDLLRASVWGLKSQPEGEVVGYLNGYNRVVLRKEDGTAFSSQSMTGDNAWLATNEELIVL